MDYAYFLFKRLNILLSLSYYILYMAGFLLPLILLIGGYIYYEKLGGKQQIDSIFNEIKGAGGGGGSSSGFQDLKNGRTGQWTDENNNKFNVQNDSNSKSNVGKSGQITQTQKSTSFFTVPRIGNL